MKKYDFLIVGAGLFGSVCAHELAKKGFSILVIEKREHVGGNIYTKLVEGINVHCYGAHIFHTSNKKIWDYINSFASFNSFINSPLANYHGELYHLPFNMNTFVELWPNIETIDDAKKIIERERVKYENPENLEEQALSLVGKTIYKKLIKEYTEKQWGKNCKQLPAFIIKRIPLRFEFNNNYFNDIFQGIPIGGYTNIINSLLKSIDVILNRKFSPSDKMIANRIIFTGPIDEYFNYCFGELEYRSLRFEHKLLNVPNFQNNAVVNYTSHDTQYTRIIEHKHFENLKSPSTVITYEYPDCWEIGKERYYTVNDNKNNELYLKYLELAKKEKNVYFGGRLGMYRYFDMDDTIEAAFELVERIVNEKR